MTDYSNIISIIMPTFRRPEGLKVALESLYRQLPGPVPVEIIIADNDPDGSARPYVEAEIAKQIADMHYLHVSSPGVSNARNAAIKLAKGRYIAWLDDDQEAGDSWLADYYEACNDLGAGLVFSPTEARIPNVTIYENYLERFFERAGPGIERGLIDEFYGCGNSFMDRALCELPSPVFDPAANETGGEDDLLFTHIQNRGAKIAWVQSAHCYEDIRPHRATPDYIRKRSFAFGQAPSEIAYEAGKPLGVIKWMLIGVLQFAVYSPLALFAKLTGRARFIHYMSKASQGAGKILWFGDFKPKLYGQAVLANKAF